MAEKACVKRLQKEFKALCKEPAPNVVARPLPNNILEWRKMNEQAQPRHALGRPVPRGFDGWEFICQPDYVLEGSKDTPFAGGYYYGKIKFPPDYPFSPPGISMTTPNGRFKTQTRICLSMSDFHPESWNPMWSVSRLLAPWHACLHIPSVDLHSYWTLILHGEFQTVSYHINFSSALTNMESSPTTGSVTTTVAEKQHLAEASLGFNCKNVTFRKMFPEYVEIYNTKQQDESAVSPAPSPERNNAKLKKEDNVLDRLQAEDNKNNKRNKRKQPLPTWLLLLMFSIFGFVIALPLLQP
ncbi:hypothetical protein V2J09_021484 [Rumex salicifolius]